MKFSQTHLIRHKLAHFSDCAESMVWPRSGAMAKQQNLKIYRGEPCKCGGTLRYTNGKKCVLCLRLKNRAHAKAKREKINSSDRLSCLECGNFMPVGMHVLKKTCSSECRRERTARQQRELERRKPRRPLTLKKCGLCGGDFVGNACQLYCSTQCKIKTRSDQERDRVRERYRRQCAAVKALEELGVKF